MIYINAKLRIKIFDDKNLELQENRVCDDAKSKTTVLKWVRLGYYGDLRSALMGALNRILFESAEDELSLKRVISAIDDARLSILKAIEGMKNAQ